MSDPVLEAKVRAPRRRRALVPRPRLTGRVARVDEASVTLVSAPAGFGKTTLLSEWGASAAAAGDVVVWLSLDAGDNDPAVLAASLVAACRSAVPGAGAGADAARLEGAPLARLAVALLDDLATAGRDVVLVLDDVHVIQAAAVHDAVAFLAEHLPQRAHLVLATRADPPFPLARWRASGELVEIRAQDLRFTPPEAGAYLTGTMGLALDAADVDVLETRTEGWIAALQLAALSLQGRADPTSFISAFAGDDRYVVDYLVEEVLHRQEPRVRDFLLRTAVLERLEADLCDAVTGADGGGEQLERLERANLFLVPLDDRRRWYRYHHLFADVLRARLRHEAPALEPELHRRASAWFESHGDRPAAITHAFAAGDVERAADLVELALPAMRRDRQDVTLRRWLEALPDDVLRVRPVLSVAHAGALMVMGDVEGVDRRLRDAERRLAVAPQARGGAAPEGMVVVDRAAFAALPVAIAMYRAALSLLAGDVEGTMNHARAALAQADPDDGVARGGPAALLALALWTRGELDAARGRYEEAIAALEGSGHTSDAIGCTLALADILRAQGRLTDAAEACERALRRAEASEPVLRGAADMHVVLGEVHLERDEVDAARRHVAAAAALGEAAGLPQHPYRLRVAQARLCLLDGDAAGALELVDAAAAVFTSDFSPDVRPLTALRARVLLALGRLEDARRWVRERRLTAADDLAYVREYEHITLARVLLAEHALRVGLRPEPQRAARPALDDVTALLARLEQAALDGGRTASLIEVLVLRALAERAAGRDAAAQAALRRAVTEAATERHARVILDEVPAVAPLLRAVAQEPDAPAHARYLAARLGEPGDGAAAPGTVRAPSDAVRDAGPAAALSERERDVLRMLATELSGPEIAREMQVSVNTLRTHTKSIYAKLGVTSRRAAVRRAGDLGLLPRDSGR